MLKTYEVDLENLKGRSIENGGETQLGFEEPKEGEDIVINEKYWRENIDGLEFQVTPSFPALIDKRNNSVKLFLSSWKRSHPFSDFDIELKFKSGSVEDIEAILPYEISSRGLQVGLLIKLKDGRIIRIGEGGISTYKKDKYRFFYSGTELVPLSKKDYSEKDLEKLKDKIFFLRREFTPDYPYTRITKKLKEILENSLKEGNNQKALFIINSKDDVEKFENIEQDDVLNIGNAVFRIPEEIRRKVLSNLDKLGKPLGFPDFLKPEDVLKQIVVDEPLNPSDKTPDIWKSSIEQLVLKTLLRTSCK